MNPLKKGKTATQAHVGLPDGTFEGEHGRKGFYPIHVLPEGGKVEWADYWASWGAKEAAKLEPVG